MTSPAYISLVLYIRVRDWNAQLRCRHLQAVGPGSEYEVLVDYTVLLACKTRVS